MDRDYLEGLSLAQLQQELIKYGLTRQTTRARCIDAIITHFERHAPKDVLSQDATVAENDSEKEMQLADTSREAVGETSPITVASPMEQVLLSITQQMQKQQEVLTHLVQLNMRDTSRSPNTAFVSEGIGRGEVAEGLTRVHERSRSISLSNISPAQAVTLLASQISVFAGSEDEDIELWLEQVEHIAGVHGVDESVMLLAATSKLTKQAKDWFEMDTTMVRGSWPNFKVAVEERFHVEVSFHIVMQKVEARRWNYQKETFQEYANQKLKLMRRLRLSEKNRIQLLISGIGSPSMRGTAVVLEATTVNEFIKKMHSVVNVYGTSQKKTSPQLTRKSKPKDSTQSQGKESSSTKAEGIFCSYCKRRGHIKAECFKLQKRESAAPAAAAAGSSSVAAAEEVVPQHKVTDAPLVGCIHEGSNRRLQISESVVTVDSIRGVQCNLLALVDTGSPVSFLQDSVCNIFFGKTNSVKGNLNVYRMLNNTCMNVVATVDTNISLITLPGLTMPVKFRIVENNQWSTHMVLGRDFFSDNNLTLIYRPSDDESRNKIQLFNEVASAECVEVADDKLDFNVHTDFGIHVDNKVIDLLESVNSAPLPDVEDDHCVTVSLKDSSTYAYAPRRFVWAERVEMRKMIDDLLKRGIVRESHSPYCARVVLVRKKNNTLRLCVDLRPLNERVVKQKYPFPVIEDCLTRLANKKVFTLLDLKDGFHHIKIHPDHCKYFSFATPDGQYEFVRLPFGYCEAPAEFQRRLIQVLQPLIREDKVLVYRKQDDVYKFVVPESMIMNLMKVYHDECAHCGTEKTVQGLSANYWFPALRKKVSEYVSNCLTCLTSCTSSNVREGEMIADNTPTVPFETIHADHFGPLTGSHDGFKYILVVVEAFTRFTWLFPVKSVSSRETVEKLSMIFDIFGNPSELVTDRGAAFTSSEFSEFVKERCVKHRLVAVAAPWANGIVERVNRFLKTSLRKITKDQKHWSDKVVDVQYVINNTYHSAVKSTPSKLLLGYDRRNHSDSKLVSFLSDLARDPDEEFSFVVQRDESRDVAAQTSDKLRNYNKIYYDKRHKTPTVYKPGDYVLIRDTVVKTGEDRKLKSAYKGPYVITKSLNKNRYVVQDVPGFNITQRPYNSILSPDRIKPWSKPNGD